LTALHQITLAKKIITYYPIRVSKVGPVGLWYCNDYFAWNVRVQQSKAILAAANGYK
jgi:hypothetical protein